MKSAVVQGCKTTHGGVVIQGHPTMTINGIGMAGKGYLTACPQCKGVFPISEGLDDFFFLDSAPLSLAGMKTACGATILPSQFLLVIDPNMPFMSQLTGNPNDDGEETIAPPKEDDKHSGCFRLVGQESGQPMANKRVRITTADGISKIYASDADGYTSWLYAEETQQVRLDMVGELQNG